MTTSRLLIGISAILDPRITPHGRTLLRSLEVFRNHYQSSAAITYDFDDDGADRDTAISVAERFVRNGVDVVVGHFSSDAALAVAPIYSHNGITLLLPAATADAITQNNSNAFRVCPNDSALARRLACFAAHRGWRTLWISSDDSVHGQMLAKAIKSAAEGTAVLTPDDSAADALVFAGRVAASGRFVSAVRARGIKMPIILTDDAASQQLSKFVSEPGELHILSFAPADSVPEGQHFRSLYRRSYGIDPDIYALEALAALQVAAAPRTREGRRFQIVSEQSFDTAVGPVRFDKGERVGAPHGLWTIEGDRLSFRRLIDDTPFSHHLHSGALAID
jgi:ABC-type branched-subunit amino acid transport system substrate-binding protein